MICQLCRATVLMMLKNVEKVLLQISRRMIGRDVIKFKKNVTILLKYYTTLTRNFVYILVAIIVFVNVLQLYLVISLSFYCNNFYVFF